MHHFIKTSSSIYKYSDPLFLHLKNTFTRMFELNNQSLSRKGQHTSSPSFDCGNAFLKLNEVLKSHTNGSLLATIYFYLFLKEQVMTCIAIRFLKNITKNNEFVQHQCTYSSRAQQTIQECLLEMQISRPLQTTDSKSLG